ncbi:unnamed protein product [Ectocarpus sp. 6 AP-2014]
MHVLKPSLGRARCCSSAVIIPHACFGQLDNDNCTHGPENPRIHRGIGSEKRVLARSGRGREPNEARKELPDRVP